MTTNHRAPDPATEPGVVERLEAALKKATPGPWVVQGRDDQPPYWIDTHAYPDGPEPVWAEPQYPVSLADAALIAEAVNALPPLLVVVRAAQDSLEGTTPAADHTMNRVALRAALADLEKAP